MNRISKVFQKVFEGPVKKQKGEQNLTIVGLATAEPEQEKSERELHGKKVERQWMDGQAGG